MSSWSAAVTTLSNSRCVVLECLEIGLGGSPMVIPTLGLLRPLIKKYYFYYYCDVGVCLADELLLLWGVEELGGDGVVEICVGIKLIPNLCYAAANEAC